MDPSHINIQAIHKTILDSDLSNVSTDAFVGVKVGNEGWLVDLAFLTEVTMPPKITQPGRCPKWVLGVGGFHGEIFTLLDMDYILSGHIISNHKQSWLTLFNKKVEGNVGLMWTNMIGLFSKSELTSFDAHDLPKFCSKVWKDNNNVFWKELSVDELMNSDFVISDK